MHVMCARLVTVLDSVRRGAQGRDHLDGTGRTHLDKAGALRSARQASATLIIERHPLTDAKTALRQMN
jgi:hypothetical protein